MDTLTEIAVPDIGDFRDVPVIEIIVAVGDTVAVEDPLVAIESEKATMEIPCPTAGVVHEILVAVGDRVSEGTPIARIEAGAAGSEPPPEPEAGAPGAAEPSPPDEAAAPSPPAGVPAPSPTPSAEPERERGLVYAGPGARRRARELAVDLSTVAGSGRRGRITIEDVERSRSAQGAAPADSLGLAPWPTVDFASFGEVERVPLTKIQTLSGSYLARNWVRIPHVTHNEDADITELEAFRKRLNAEQADVKVTMVALLLKAAAAALREHPVLNSSLDGDELVLKRYYNIGFAADTPRGLVVPVVREVDRKGLMAIAAEVSELSGKARAGRLTPTEMSGGTFTISSLGGIGGTSFTPIVNAPEVAILGVVRSAMRPVWDGGAFQPRLILPLSLSYDHRVIDGAVAARFCATLAALLSDMRRALL